MKYAESPLNLVGRASFKTEAGHGGGRRGSSGHETDGDDDTEGEIDKYSG